MGVLIVILGIGWLLYTILKEEVFTKQIPKGTDMRQALIDSNYIGEKEVERRINSGYYVRKDK